MDYVTAVSSVGFPIVMCGYFMVVLNKTLKQNTEATNNNTAVSKLILKKLLKD
ncbi:hypothetical protein KAS08_02465 [Candidatus Pacearchaeota archaeon]|nr:hypothetical protein [Candidatus Pacearchaeota archaeon]